MAEPAWRFLFVGGVTLLALATALVASRIRTARAERRVIDPGGTAGRVILYSSSVCPSCDRLRGMLNHLEVEFNEVRFDDQPAAHRSAGVESVPLLVLRLPDGTVAGQVAGVPSSRRLRRSMVRAGITPGTK